MIEDEKSKPREVVTGMYGYAPQYKFAEPPKPAGAWILYPGAPWTTRFTMYAKPTDEQIKNTEELLGWKWEDV